MKYQGKIKRDGTIEFLGEAPPGWQPTRKQRFSEIVPVHPVKRLAFRALRWMFGEQGRVSDWTRRWRCRWEATILMGRTKGTRRRSEDRAFLLHWEQQVWRNS